MHLRRFLATLSLTVLVMGCSSLTVRVHILSVSVSPRTLPREGGKVKIVVKTYNADEVRVSFQRLSDGRVFSLWLSQEFHWGFALGEQKWDGEIRLPPNEDPEGKDQIYRVTVRAWGSGYSEHVRSEGEVVVKGAEEPESAAESEPSQANSPLSEEHSGKT